MNGTSFYIRSYARLDKQFHADKSLYVKRIEGSITLLVVYVDDMKITGNNQSSIDEVIDQLSAQFAVRRLDSSSKFFGMAIEKSPAATKIHHEPLINRMLLFFSMEDCYSTRVPLHPGADLSISGVRREGESTKTMDGTPYRQLVGCLLHLANTTRPDIAYASTMDGTPYRQLVGCLLHLANTTRPDIAYASNYLSRFMHDPSPSLWKAAKSVLRYLKGTKKLGIVYSKGHIHDKEDMVSGFSDSDWAQEKPSRKSISGYVFMFAGGAVSWRSKQQTSVAQSSLEAEYIALAFAIPEALWFRNFGVIVNPVTDGMPLSIKSDNQGCISVAQNGIMNERTKHIDVKYQMIVHNVAKSNTTISHIPTIEMVADIMTKALAVKPFEYLKRKLCIEP